LKLLTFATEMEAESSRKLLERDYTILVTGMGCLNAAIAVTPWLKDCTEIWNLGIAGALNPSCKAGNIYTVSSVSKLNTFPQNIDSYSNDFALKLCPDIEIATEGLRLISSDFPLHSQERKIANNADLIDMEAYGIASACKRHGVKCHFLKAVSDFCNNDGPAQIKERLPALSLKLAEEFIAQTYNGACL
jgi:nucleoside phosphorylase